MYVSRHGWLVGVAFHPVGSRDRTLVFRLGSSLLQASSHLTGLCYCFYSWPAIFLIGLLQQPVIAFLGQKYWLVMSQSSDFTLIIPFLLFIALYNGRMSTAWTSTKQNTRWGVGEGRGRRSRVREGRGWRWREGRNNTSKKSLHKRPFCLHEEHPGLT